MTLWLLKLQYIAAEIIRWFGQLDVRWLQKQLS